MSHPEPPPELPQGTITLLGTVSDNFSFHASPEVFITSRILRLHQQNPSLQHHRGILRAKILNRNVAIVTSHTLVRAILGDDRDGVLDPREEVPGSTFTAAKAYDELMAPFFPPPNLLLADPPKHGAMKEGWRERLETSLSDELGDECLGKGSNMETMEFVKRVTKDHFRLISSGSIVDLYESMKDLSWQLLLGIFLSLEKGSPSYKEIEGLQEDLLRGQFSLFPVSINTRFWKSPRSRGLDARRKLEILLAARVRDGGGGGCPFAMQNEAERADVASHLLLFTSSLAAKAMASFLTAYLLNVYIHRGGAKQQTVIESWYAAKDKAKGETLLNSAIIETGRLSPPVVGVMRRAERDAVVKTANGQPDTLIPKGWDVWLYFAAAGRDPEKYTDANRYHPERYLSKNKAEGLGFEFGWGPKSCLGGPLVHKIARTVANACIEMDLKIEADMIEKGVRGWLGWEDVSPEDWAKDMKQLPTQRPQKPLNVRISYYIAG